MKPIAPLPSRLFAVNALFLSAMVAVCGFYSAYAQADISHPLPLVPPLADSLKDTAHVAENDSLSREFARRDSLLKVVGPQSSASDPDAREKERAAQYAVGFMGDWGAHGLGGKDVAAAVYVIAAVAVIGGTLIYLPVLIYKMVRNQESYPLYHELGLTYTYSGTSWEGGGSPLYRDTHMPGLRYTALIGHPYLAMGLTLESGYLAPTLEEAWDPATRVDLGGLYGLIGPQLRFGAQSPIHFSLEFLNGTSTASAVGWITKARANLQAKLGNHALVGLSVGSLFYDLHFFDGTVWRSGAFNRDLALTLGIETGYRF